MRRRCLGIRCRTGVVLIIMLLSLCAVYLSYKSLGNEEGTSYHQRNIPSLDRRKGLRFQAVKLRHKQPENLAELQAINRLGHNFQQQKKTMMTGALYFHPVLQKKILSFVSELFPKDWGSARDPDEVALELKSLLLDIGIESNMTCKEIDNLQISGALSYSNKKYIERGRFDDYRQPEVTIKSQSVDVETKNECMEKTYDVDHCTPMGNYKLMREILYLALFRHPTIVSMLGYCVRGDQISPEIRKKGLVLITEMGSPIQPGSFSSMPWENKLKFAVQLANLLEYLEKTPIGHVSLGKLDMRDFILVNSGYSLRLVDLDDMVPMETSCYSDSDCYVEGKSLGVRCRSGRCAGLNKAFNMHKLGTVMLDPILRQSPPSQAQRVDDLLSRLVNNQITAQQLSTILAEIQEESGGQNADTYRQQEPEQDQQPVQRRVVQPEDDPDLNRPSRTKQTQTRSEGSYIRYEQSNYQGIYDFTCPTSLVMWGCVLTAKSIKDSQQICDVYPQCQSFVIYSSHPEADTLMTIVLKNSSAINPQQSGGTTLFVRREGGGKQPVLDSGGNQNTDTEQNNDKQNGDQGNNPAVDQEAATAMCIKKNAKNHLEAHRSRERRLMTHLGLKGLRESDWFESVTSQTIVSFNGVMAATGESPRGGKMVVKFAPQNSQSVVRKAQFLAEKGPEQYHSAQAIVYHTDRLLGLYHVPPTIMMMLSSELVQKFSDNTDFNNVFAPLIGREGWVKGLLTVPMPRVMKPESLTLKPLKTMVTTVKKFTRLMKMQLEYVFLWSLTKITKGTDAHIGYRGHLIHFDGDQAFQDPLVELTGYFLHCQFPNIVYKSLNCFRCRSQSHNSSLCYLGQEVMRRVKEGNFTISELQIRNYNENEFTILINDAATVALSIIDQCVKAFGKENVLY